MSTSMVRSTDSQSPRVFYGWIIVIACFLVTFTQGETMFSFGIFLKPLEGEFQWSRALTSTAYSALLLGYAVSCVVAGRLSDRYSPRPVLLAAALLGGAGMALCSLASDINQLRLWMLVSGLGAGATASVPAAVVQKWFLNRPRAGLALAIVTCGSGIGMIVYPPFVTYVILSHGWRIAYLALGILLFVLTGAGALAVRNRPGALTIKVNEGSPEGGVSLRQLLVDRAFLAVVFATTSGIFMFQSISAHLAAFATDAGISQTEAALALGVFGALTIPGRLVSGITAERLSWRKVLSVALLGMGASILILLVGKSTFMLFLFVIFFGLAQGLRVPSQLGILAYYFGTHNLGLLIGICSCVGQFAGVFAPYFCGFVYDQTGSYYIAFGILAALCLTGALVTLSIKKAPAAAVRNGLFHPEHHPA